MSLEQLSAQLNGQQQGKACKIPPVELWDPPFCGEIDLQIKADGTWYYQGTPFKRLALVKLFASVLKKENNDYFLVTPVEKVKIRVDDAPMLLTQWRWQDDSHTTMLVSTNMEDEFVLDSEHPLTQSADGSLYVIVRRNLLAKVHRNVYYQWADIATEQRTSKGIELTFSSAGRQFSLGLLA